MREVKFRAWDKDSKKWSQTPMKYAIEDINYYTDYEWCQYTGLIDKNGTEIYEGDIVQCNGNKNDLHEVKFGEFTVKDIDTYESVEKAVGWYFQILDSDVFSKVSPFFYPVPLNSYWINRIDIKVIGNIYENSKLLGGTENE